MNVCKVEAFRHLNADFKVSRLYAILPSVWHSCLYPKVRFQYGLERYEDLGILALTKNRFVPVHKKQYRPDCVSLIFFEEGLLKDDVENRISLSPSVLSFT